MAAVYSPTTKMYEAASKALSGAAHSSFVAIVLESANMASFDDSTIAPVTPVTAAGLEVVAATISLQTVTNSNDSVQAEHVFTAAAGAVAIEGFEVVDSVSNTGNVLMWAHFSAPVTLEVNDRLTCIGKIQFVKGV